MCPIYKERKKQKKNTLNATKNDFKHYDEKLNIVLVSNNEDSYKKKHIFYFYFS